ncbi:MAG: S-layer homology domain-containing protein, partial [Clostridia bacterium]|nr:S-layer homology domain-containing protein [Clostridia bacterium]
MKKAFSFLLSAVMLFAAALPAVPAPDAGYDSSAAFVDVPSGAWFREYVDFVASRGIMGGDGTPYTFLPQKFSTRAMIAVILHRLEGKPQASGASGFTDITADWYIPAVEWAYGAGVVKGVSATAFNPDAAV